MATKRTIKVQILPGGEIKIDNAGNPDESRIMGELSKLAELLTGEPTDFKVEKHVHDHAHSHQHDGGKVHTHG